MLVVIPVSKNDFNSAIMCFSFIKALKHFGPYKEHKLLIVVRPEDSVYGSIIEDNVKELFGSTTVYSFSENGPTGWPEGPNFYWKETIKYLKQQSNPFPWFWMEIDVTPLKHNWIDILEEEYYKRGMPCLGTIENTTTVTTDHFKFNTGKYLQGTAVYHPQLHEYCSIWEYVDKVDTAFDIITQWELVPETADTRLIQQGLRTIEYTFKRNGLFLTIQGKNNGDWGELISYNQPLNADAILHHGCKDGSLAQIVTSNEYKEFLSHQKLLPLIAKECRKLHEQ